VKYLSKVWQSFLENPELYGNMISNTLKSAFGEFFESHIGVELANTYFQHLKQKFAIHFESFQVKFYLF
jgi:hypothetical protein